MVWAEGRRFPGLRSMCSELLEKYSVAESITWPLMLSHGGKEFQVSGSGTGQRQACFPTIAPSKILYVIEI